MRSVLFVPVATLLAGCATAPPTNTTQVYDHKYNNVRSVAKHANSEFVGTSASATTK